MMGAVEQAALCARLPKWLTRFVKIISLEMVVYIALVIMLYWQNISENVIQIAVNTPLLARPPGRLQLFVQIISLEWLV